MKRIALFILLSSCFALHSYSQDFAYEFAKADGTIVPDGSVVTITTAEDAGDGSGDIFMDAALYAKNVDGDADDLLRIAYEVQTMESGDMQICFPSACKNINSVSSGTTNPGKLNGERHSIATEWFPMEYGRCTVKLSLQTVVKTKGNNYEVIDDGPTITLNFVYSDPASVRSSSVSVATPVAYYSLSGQRLSGRPHGIVMVRLSDGRVVKRVIR